MVRQSSIFRRKAESAPANPVGAGQRTDRILKDQKPAALPTSGSLPAGMVNYAGVAIWPEPVKRWPYYTATTPRHGGADG